MDVKFLFFISVFAVAFTSSAPLHPTLAFADAPSEYSVSTSELTQEISAHLMDTPEFKFVREEALHLGISHLYLFGGTAAALGHYAKWNVQRQNGDTRFQPDRFDYDYTNIYRSTQDADIVIDGTTGQAQALQKALSEKFPHLQGSKSVWEVRLLKSKIGDKEALLDNPDYLNQHTDSNSTGMIELTQSHDPLIRDLRDWKAKEPIFLKDIESGTLHYYFSALHETTSRYQEGKNPPIVSVIRYLTKAFQYELKIPPEDEARIKRIIDQFHPNSVTGSYLPGWIEKNGKKLIQNAVNIEYAWNELERLGLRQKLIAIQNNPASYDSLAFWMNKEPLRSQPLGVGRGKTAKDLGIDVVAHETNSFLAYESITRAHTGDANVLISRVKTPGEAAVSGDGFYTAIGTKGARNTGLTIRFHVNPDAREGEDFKLVGNFVIFSNKNAIRVIPESLNIGPVQFFEILAQGQALDDSDRGILEKLKRRLDRDFALISTGDEAKIVSIVSEELKKPVPNETVLKQWSLVPSFNRYPELADEVMIALLRSKDVNHQWAAVNYLTKVRELRPLHWDALFNFLEKYIDEPYNQSRHYLNKATVDLVVGRLNQDGIKGSFQYLDHILRTTRNNHTFDLDEFSKLFREALMSLHKDYPEIEAGFVQLVHKYPHRSESVLSLMKADCQSEDCVNAYAKAISSGSFGDTTNITQLIPLPKNGPLDMRIVEAVGQRIKSAYFPNDFANFYLDHSGSNLKVLETIREAYSRPASNPSPEFLKKLADRIQSVSKAKCVAESLEGRL